MQSQLDQLVKLHETKAVELALAVAKRLVGDVVDERRDYIQGVVSQAVQLANGSKILSVRVGPNDFEFLKLSQYAEQTRIILGEGVKFISDESIRAGCVLVTSAGEIDFNLDAAWERIKSRVLSRG
jgi:flagellar assembly protein FliH